MKKSVLALVAFTAGFLIQFPARVFADPAGDVQVAMQLFKLKAAKLGSPAVNGEEAVAGKIVPALHFGATQMHHMAPVIGHAWVFGRSTCVTSFETKKSSISCPGSYWLKMKVSSRKSV